MMSEETKIENGEDFAAMLEESFKTLNTGEKVKMCIRDRHYEVRVRGRLDNIPRLEEPMEIDGYAIRPARVVILEQDSESAKLRLTIHEGRNRQIRKMCEQCGLEVRRLKRVAVGELPLDPALKAGAWRELTPEEVAYLRGVGAILQD